MSHEEIYNNFKEALFNASEEVKNDVLELKFGCQLLWHDNSNHIIIEINEEKFWTDLTNNHCGHNFGFSLKEDLKTEVKEILGRHITLEDVLRALQENNDWVKNGFIGIGSDGYFNRTLPNTTSIEHYKWLLGKPASEQSDECLMELTKLLTAN